MAEETKMARITVDGAEYEVADGMNLFEAVEQVKGFKLPHFCYHPGLSIAGVCRMCQVEIEGVPKLVIACNARVQDGMEVRTQTDRVQQTVRNILNFHLLHHPVDCPVCDQAGECSLQDFYMDHGLYESDIDHEEKIAKGKVKPIGELVMLDAERCVLCARCTRFTSEITKTNELGIFNRGNHSEIDVAPGKTLDNNYSLNTVDICPVGALTSRDFRFRKRVWWLEETESVCPGCATGCNMTTFQNEGTVYRFKPRDNEDVNQYWMCDHGRLLYKKIAGEHRLASPRVRDDGAQRPAGWDEAYRTLQASIRDRELIFVGSPHATLEEQYAFGRLSQITGGRLLGARLAGTETAEADGLLLAADRTPNAEGARRLGQGEFAAQALRDAAGDGRVLVVLENDLLGLDPSLEDAIGSFAAVVWIGADHTTTAAAATVALPGLNYAEKNGIFVNEKGRAQALNAAVPGPVEARDPLRILRELAETAGHDFTWKSVEEVRRELASTHDGFGALAAGVGPLGLPLEGNGAATAPSTASGEAGEER